MWTPSTPACPACAAWDERIATIVFTNVRIFDGVSDALAEGRSVSLKDGRIAEVSGRPANRDDGEVVDGGGRTLMPGLINAHIHAYAKSVSFYEVTDAPQSLLTGWASYVLPRMLQHGFTAVRDTGGADNGLFLALQRGWIQGPRLYYCGRAISQTGGQVDFRNPHHHDEGENHLLACGCGRVSAIATVVDGVDVVHRVVRENLFRGSNFINFTDSGGVSSGDKLESIQFSDEEVLAMVDEVTRHGAYCTAHIHPDAALKRVLKLGVHCIEHGTLIEPDTARMAADAGTYIVPTLAVTESLVQ